MGHCCRKLASYDVKEEEKNADHRSKRSRASSRSFVAQEEQTADGKYKSQRRSSADEQQEVVQNSVPSDRGHINAVDLTDEGNHVDTPASTGNQRIVVPLELDGDEVIDCTLRTVPLKNNSSHEAQENKHGTQNQRTCEYDNPAFSDESNDEKDAGDHRSESPLQQTAATESNDTETKEKSSSKVISGSFTGKQMEVHSKVQVPEPDSDSDDRADNSKLADDVVVAEVHVVQNSDRKPSTQSRDSADVSFEDRSSPRSPISAVTESSDNTHGEIDLGDIDLTEVSESKDIPPVSVFDSCSNGSNNNHARNEDRYNTNDHHDVNCSDRESPVGGAIPYGYSSDSGNSSNGSSPKLNQKDEQRPVQNSFAPEEQSAQAEYLSETITLPFDFTMERYSNGDQQKTEEMQMFGKGPTEDGSFESKPGELLTDEVSLQNAQENTLANTDLKVTSNDKEENVGENTSVASSSVGYITESVAFRQKASDHSKCDHQASEEPDTSEKPGISVKTEINSIPDNDVRTKCSDSGMSLSATLPVSQNRNPESVSDYLASLDVNGYTLPYDYTMERHKRNSRGSKINTTNDSSSMGEVLADETFQISCSSVQSSGDDVHDPNHSNHTSSEPGGPLSHIKVKYSSDVDTSITSKGASSVLPNNDQDSYEAMYLSDSISFENDRVEGKKPGSSKLGTPDEVSDADTVLGKKDDGDDADYLLAPKTHSSDAHTTLISLPSSSSNNSSVTVSSEPFIVSTLASQVKSTSDSLPQSGARNYSDHELAQGDSHMGVSSSRASVVTSHISSSDHVTRIKLSPYTVEAKSRESLGNFEKINLDTLKADENANETIISLPSVGSVSISGEPASERCTVLDGKQNVTNVKKDSVDEIYNPEKINLDHTAVSDSEEGHYAGSQSVCVSTSDAQQGTSGKLSGTIIGSTSGNSDLQEEKKNVEIEEAIITALCNRQNKDTNDGGVASLVRDLATQNENSIRQKLVDAGVQCERTDSDKETNTSAVGSHMEQEIHSMTQDLIKKLQNGGQFSEEEVRRLLQDFKDRQKQLLATREAEKNKLDALLQQKLKGVNKEDAMRPTGGEIVIEDDLDLSDEDDILRQYGDLMLHKSLDEELSEASGTCEESDSEETSTSSEEVSVGESKVLQASLKQDIKSNLPSMTADDFGELMSLYRQERDMARTARAGERDRLNQSLWRKLQGKTRLAEDEDEMESAKDDEIPNSVPQQITESKLPPATDKLGHRDENDISSPVRDEAKREEFVGMVLALVQEKKDIQETEVRDLLQRHLQEIEDIRNSRQREKETLDNKLQDKLNRRGHQEKEGNEEEETTPDETQLTPLDRKLCRDISLRSRTLDRSELTSLLNRYQEDQAKILQKQEAERAKLDARLQEKLRGKARESTSHGKCQEENDETAPPAIMDDQSSSSEVIETPDEQPETKDTETSPTGLVPMSLEDKLTRVKHEAVEGMKRMDETFYQRLSSQADMSDSEVDKQVEKHLDRVDSFQRRKEREIRAIRRRLEQQVQRRRREREEQAQAEQEREETRRRLQAEAMELQSQGASDILQEHQEHAHQLRKLRDREREVTDKRLQEKLAKKKKRGSKRNSWGRSATEGAVKPINVTSPEDFV